MRASRLLTIQMLLQTRGRMSAQSLAQTLEVSLRTLYRDIDQLSAAGVPIYAERGRLGGFELLPGWTTTLTGFTAAEAQAVFISGLAGPAAQLGLGRDVSAAQLKLMAALPSSQRHDARRIQSRFHLDPVAWYQETDEVPHLATVAAAVWNDRQLKLEYESWKGVSRRTVSPLGLVMKAGLWYLVAASSEKPRTYRVSKILDVQSLESRSVRAEKFDLATYWADSLKRFESEIYQEHAVVLATPKGISNLRQLSAAVAKAVQDTPQRPRPGARIKLTIPVEAGTHAVGQLLLLAPEVEVVAPKALRDAVSARLKQISDFYGIGSR